MLLRLNCYRRPRESMQQQLPGWVPSAAMIQSMWQDPSLLMVRLLLLLLWLVLLLPLMMMLLPARVLPIVLLRLLLSLLLLLLLFFLLVHVLLPLLQSRRRPRPRPSGLSQFEPIAVACQNSCPPCRAACVFFLWGLSTHRVLSLSTAGVRA